MSMSMLPNVNATAGAAVDGALFIEVAQRWPIAATAVVACAVALLLQTVLKSDPWADIPMVGTEFGGSEARRKQFMNGEARNLYLNGYRKFKERAFRITTARKSPNIVVAPKFMNELKRLPDDVLSFNRAIEEVSLRQGLYNKEATLMDP
ncbi:hypothetical protein COL5a_004016 [Colletotrichum fioriniae]|nr:uncharacterized protein COL516b_000092 [Colletotrichum fioriniae]KAJ0313165.1 hypothetical protein COL516b_000092 [Colletotrichum fioriniae]KAJ0329458.1 hypothetical protein COL5a_004016 [Colletotrichum fioriniae]